MSASDLELAVKPDIHGLALKSLEQLTEPVDPRLSPDSRPSSDELDEGVLQRVASAFHEHHHHHSRDEKAHEPIYIDFEKDDPRDPVNFTRRRKWAITFCACVLTVLSASTASTYAMGYQSMIRDLNCTLFQATIGLSLYALGFGLIPLASSALSEELGRQPLYIFCTIGFTLMHLMVGLSKNIETVLIARFLAGAFGSTGSTLAGGTVADIWMPNERGLPMSIFALSAIAATGMGPVAAGWIEQNPHLQWRWIQWVETIITGTYLIFVPICMRETRRAVLLTRLAKQTRRETGDRRYRARAEDERGSLRSLILVSCSRPVYLLLTEPVVASFSLWIGFAWGILYCMIESIEPIFSTLHGFSIGEIGMVFITFTIGSVLGYATNMYQEMLYKKNFPTRGPEARLYAACVAAILFPVGMFIYAWTSFAKVHWIGLCFGITLFVWALFIMYLAVFTYLADCYGPFASSALAGQSLCRNIAGMAFPLFTQQMYARLTYKWSSTLFALLATLMMPIPFILFMYGPAIRARSRVAKLMLKDSV